MAFLCLVHICSYLSFKAYIGLRFLWEVFLNFFRPLMFSHYIIYLNIIKSVIFHYNYLFSHLLSFVGCNLINWWACLCLLITIPLIPFIVRSLVNNRYRLLVNWINDTPWQMKHTHESYCEYLCLQRKKEKPSSEGSLLFFVLFVM